MTPKGNPTTYKDPPNPIPNLPDDPDSDPGLSDSSLSDSSDSSDNKYFKQRQRTKNNKINSGVKSVLTLPESAQLLQLSYLQLRTY